MRCPLRSSLPMMRLFALLWVLFVLPTPIVLAELTASELRGLSIYQSGKSPTSAEQITAYFGEQRIPLPGETLPCTGCHGHDGTGRPESGLFPSNITWSFLTKTYGHQHKDGLEHPPFTATSLKRYLENGTFPGDVSSKNFDMPIYAMSEQDLEDLVAYLKRLGETLEAGVSEKQIKLGTILPQDGPLAGIAKTINETLRATLSEINQNGGIFGRQLELKTLFLPYGQALTPEQLEVWLEEQSPFALLSPFVPQNEAALIDICKRRAIPLIGPYTLFSVAEFAHNRQTFYLYPGLNEQLQTLISHVVHEQNLQTPQLIIVHPEQSLFSPVIKKLEDFSRSRGWAKPQQITFEIGSDKKQFNGLNKKKTSVVVLLGDEAQTESFLQTADASGWRPTVIASGLLAGRTAVTAPTDFSGRFYLSYSTLPLDRKQSGLEELTRLQQSHDLSLAHIQATISSYSSAKILIEALRRSGRKLDRTVLTTTLEQFDHFETGLTPSISFSGNQHIGVQGIHVVRFNSDSSRSKLDSRWIKLEEGL